MIAKSARALVFASLLAGCGSSGASSDPAASRSTATHARTTGTQTTAPVTTTAAVVTSVDPCRLFTTQDASRLAGTALSHAPGGDLGANTCAYSAGKVLIGAELTVRIDASAAAAHAEFSKWVEPVPNTAPGFSVIPVANLGDEARATRSSFADGISFRAGAVLVKIGVYPPVSEGALKTAALRARDRL